VAGNWRRLHNMDLHKCDSLPSMIQANNSRRMSCARHVTRLREIRKASNILFGKTERRNRLAGQA
jgi:hypothetical protein